MKIQLPNGQQHTLDEHISLDDKLKVVEELTEEFMEVIKLNWYSNSVKYFLDSLVNYIVWHKEPEEKGLEDKEILSRKKMEKMVRFKKTSKTTNFSDLSKSDSEKLFGENGVQN
jgi:hypothetical protein